MDSAFVKRETRKLSHRIGALVLCIHCFQSLGRATAKTSREVLISRHRCIESELAKQPAAPPPYN